MRLKTFPILPLVFLAAQAAAATPVTLGNEFIRVVASIEKGQLHEDYAARGDGGWVSVATDAEGASVDPSILSLGEGTVVPGTAVSVALREGSLVEELRMGGVKVVRTIAFCPESAWLHVTTRMVSPGGKRMHGFSDRFRFSRNPDWSFAPSVGGFVPDAQYKAPVIMVQSAQVAFAIIPDVAALNPLLLRQCSHMLDLDVPAGPLLGVGYVPARLAYHSVYSPDGPKTWSAATAPINAYYLLVTARAEPAAAYREVVRMQWRHFGHPTQLRAAVQQTGTATPRGVYWYVQTRGPIDTQIAMDRDLEGLGLWDEWRTQVWDRQSVKGWLPVPLKEGAVGGGVGTLRWGTGPSVYFTAWFNTLRTSTGMALYARRVGNESLLALAHQTIALALAAPGRDGAFKCIALPQGPGKKVLWAAGDGAGDSTVEGYLGYDMSWTGYWLLRWRAAHLGESAPILERCRALAQFLCARQEPDGMLPTRFAEDGSVIEGLSRTVKAETGPAALFLLELYAQDPDPRWLEAGKRALEFLERSVIPERQWYDFETFWSCSPRGPKFDARSHQWPANDLALGQSVEAFLSAYRITKNPHFLASGERLLDYLLLYQQCWTNPLLEGVRGPETLLGGFTTQNSDAEWSDARQSQCGSILLDYYRATGKPEYLERGVAALRAQFPVSPCENWAHSGYGAKSGLSSFHWGTGSGMAGIELEDDFLRDAVVDVASGCAVGVNGLDVSASRVENGEIRVAFSSPFPWKRPPVFVFHGSEANRKYTVIANGAIAGTWTGRELEEGVALKAAAPR